MATIVGFSKMKDAKISNQIWARIEGGFILEATD